MSTLTVVLGGTGGVGRALVTDPAALAAAVAGADQPHSVGYVPDVAKALVHLGEHPRAAGRVWHLPVAPPVTVREVAVMVAEHLGRPVKVTVTPALALRPIGMFVPLMREVAATSHQWDRPFVVDDTAYRAAFEPVEVTPIEEALRTTLASWTAPVPA